jgi:hypothetical protein
MADFTAEPSPEYQRLKAEHHALMKRCGEANAAGRYEEHERLKDELSAVGDALERTPDQQYINEMNRVEWEATQARLQAAYAKEGRSAVVLSFERSALDESETRAEAVSGFGMVQRAANLVVRSEDLVTVIADMRELTAAELVSVLRRFADSIEDGDGVEVLRLRMHREPGGTWDYSVMETVRGEIKYDLW